MEVAIIKYNAGNVCSVECALRRLGVKAVITDDASRLRQVDKVIFPGVGEAKTTMEFLQASGLDAVIRSLEKPVLGICLGMQLMCRHSEEGDVDGLGIFDVNVKRFRATSHADKIPHMGWNTLLDTQSSLFRGFVRPEYVYFVHSYYVPLNECTIAATDYIQPFSSALHKDNFYATQFHPEKSGTVGERILQNFLEL